MTIAQPTPKPEQVFLDTRDVKVTSARVVIGEKTYAMANITSVSVKTLPTPAPGNGLAILGLLTAIIFGMFSAATLSSPSVFAVFPLAIALLGVGLFWLGHRMNSQNTETPDNVLTLQTSGGEMNVLTSKELAFVKNVSEAITNAMIARG